MSGYEIDTVNKMKAIVTDTLVMADAGITQMITVTTAGTPVQGPDVTNPGGWVIIGAGANTGKAYWMFHGQTTANKGFPITQALPIPVENLSSLDFDVSVNGEKVVAYKL
jgi:hypothetical protein